MGHHLTDNEALRMRENHWETFHGRNWYTRAGPRYDPMYHPPRPPSPSDRLIDSFGRGPYHGYTPPPLSDADESDLLIPDGTPISEEGEEGSSSSGPLPSYRVGETPPRKRRRKKLSQSSGLNLPSSGSSDASTVNASSGPKKKKRRKKGG